jgi:hypothetical protein
MPVVHKYQNLKVKDNKPETDLLLQPAFFRFLMRHPTATTIVSTVLGIVLANILLLLLKMLLSSAL